MARMTWIFALEDGAHRIELEHGVWSGRRIIRVDGRVMEQSVKLWDTGGDYPIDIRGHPCIVRIKYNWRFTYKYELLVDGRTVPPNADFPQHSSLSAEITETERTEESIGEDERLIDNSKSSISLKRRFTIDREWLQAYSIEHENIQSDSASVSLDLPKIAGLKLTIEQQIRQKYAVTEQIRKTDSEEVVLEIPPKTKLRVYFQWKRIWQHGLIRIGLESQREIIIPFQVVVGVTFDQRQVDEI